MSESEFTKPKMSRRESDLLSVREERKANAFPFSLTPFVDDKGQPVDELTDGLQEVQEGELRVKAPEEVPWIDLLLEISMTTAFASLTDGTPVLQWDNALSYVCYFFFVWWIWASQVAYNMRFRQADWLHRIWTFAQLVVFSALAAFTKDFDITDGLMDDPDQAKANDLFSQVGSDKSALAAFAFRNERLPRLNAKGISVVLAISRVVLLVQYLIIIFHAKRRGFPLRSLLVHAGSLVLSAASFMAVFIMLGTADDTVTPSMGTQIGKLVLWSVPILLEIGVHFGALQMPGYVRYTTESVYARSGTAFIIVLGSGLDKITSGFQYIVGNTGLGSDGIPIFIAAAMIFIGYFSLYFSTPGSKREVRSKRAMSWFFSQFFFLAALIVTLQGIATNVGFTNLWGAIKKNDAAMQPVFEWMNQHPNKTIDPNNFATSRDLFNKLGISLDDITDELNQQISFAGNNSDILQMAQLEVEMGIIYYYILPAFDADPDDGSLLLAKIENFLTFDTSTGNTSVVNMESFQDLRDGIVKDRGSSALWFYPAAGSTILAIVLMTFIKGLPRDGWEWAHVVNRSVFGIGICSLALFDLGSSAPVFDSKGNLTNSVIWQIVLGDSHWLLIILAVAIGLMQIIEYSMAYASSRQYSDFDDLNFLRGPVERRRTQRPPKMAQHGYSSSDADTIPLKPYQYQDLKYQESPAPYGPPAPYGGPSPGRAPAPYSDPYDPYEDTKDSTLYQHGGA